MILALKQTQTLGVNEPKDVLSLCVMIIYSQILSAMEISGSLILLELLISIMCREALHVYEDEIQNSIVRFIKR